MKTLLLMRHAKSSWKDPDVPDPERPLNKRGKKDAPRMGSLLVDKELVPQRILCSTAVRARATAEEVIAKSGFNGDILYLDTFYLAEPQTYLETLRVLPDDIERVMVIGHNPGLEGLVQILSKEVESLPTGAIAYLIAPIKHWKDLSDDVSADLVSVWRPRDLKEKEKDKDKEK